MYASHAYALTFLLCFGHNVVIFTSLSEVKYFLTTILSFFMNASIALGLLIISFLVTGRETIALKQGFIVGFLVR